MVASSYRYCAQRFVQVAFPSTVRYPLRSRSVRGTPAPFSGKQEMMMSEEGALSLHRLGDAQSVSPRIFIRFRPPVSKDTHQAHIGRPGHPHKAVKLVTGAIQNTAPAAHPTTLLPTRTNFLRVFVSPSYHLGPQRITQRQTPPARTERGSDCPTGCWGSQKLRFPPHGRETHIP